ncbi:hypothetical protein WJX79_000646 [Trebouxia sp. C0005]
MFFHLNLNKDIEVEPRFFGPRLQEILKQKVTSEVEGTCSGLYGFMLMVTDIGSIGKGKIREGTGSAVFHVQYTCLVFRPFKGEVLDAVVLSVNKMGFFADAGPLQIFVSQHLIPSHYRVEITDDAAFESEENAPPIKAGASVRVRLMGLKAEANQLFCVATIAEDFLGIVGD